MSISSVDSNILHVKPEVSLNIAADVDRVLYVLNKIIERAKFVGLFDFFFKDDGRLLRENLDVNTCNIIFDALEKCENNNSMDGLSPMNSTSFGSPSQKSRGSPKNLFTEKIETDGNGSESSASFSTETSSSDTKFSVRNDNALCNLVYLMEDVDEVKRLAHSYQKELSPAMKFFIKTLQEFVDRMTVQLNETPLQSKNREKYLRETYEKYKKSKVEIERLEEELVVTKTDANVCLIGRNILINRHKNKIDRIKMNSLEAIDKRVNESEKAMVNNWKESLVLQERLKQDFTQVSQKYSTLLKDHLATEKVLRAKRAKVENQVLGWIQKFDQDIGEKQAEEEEVQELLDKETKQINEIQSKLDEQEEEYDDLMQEKAEYEKEILERRLYQFVVNRSARRIQRTFRLYKARKLAKKLAKKSKKKNK